MTDNTYASAARKSAVGPNPPRIMSQQEKRDERFWECRRSLRLWPVDPPNAAGVRSFLEDKLGVEEDFMDNAGHIEVKKVYERKSKFTDEVVVTFIDKGTRDAVKARAPALANFRDEAGMRLQVPDHLQKTFRALMNLSYDLKKKHPTLRRSIKFDEDSLGLYMDIQMDSDAEWKRIDAEQALKANQRRTRTAGPSQFSQDEIEDLLGQTAEDSVP